MWDLRSRCGEYAAFLEYELEDRKLAWEIVDDMLFGKNWAGAKFLCAECPIKSQCLEDALNDPEAKGWRAIGQKSRERIQKSQRLPIAA